MEEVVAASLAIRPGSVALAVQTVTTVACPSEQLFVKLAPVGEAIAVASCKKT